MVVDLIKVYFWRRPSSLKNENSRREAEITKDSRKFNKDPSLDNDVKFQNILIFLISISSSNSQPTLNF